jgi:hypothetical protein
MMLEAIEVKKACCRSSIPKGDQNIIIRAALALACFSIEAMAERFPVPRETVVRGCLASSFGAAMRVRTRSAFAGCFLTCSLVLTNGFVVGRFAFTVFLVRPFADLTGARELCRLITSS